MTMQQPLNESVSINMTDFKKEAVKGMVTLIIGGSGSGKSAFAEDLINRLSLDRPKYYLATMQPFGKENEAKIQRHKVLRSGKKFDTIEQPTDISDAIEKMEAKDKTALLECMSNLVANEMFSSDPARTKEEVTEKIIKGILKLKDSLTDLVIVSNNVFEDGILYDPVTTEYIACLGAINQKLSCMADCVVEVVVGIPLILKGKEKIGCV